MLLRRSVLYLQYKLAFTTHLMASMYFLTCLSTFTPAADLGLDNVPFLVTFLKKLTYCVESLLGHHAIYTTQSYHIMWCTLVLLVPVGQLHPCLCLNSGGFHLFLGIGDNIVGTGSDKLRTRTQINYWTLHGHHIHTECLEFLNMWIVEHFVGDIKVMRILDQIV